MRSAIRLHSMPMGFCLSILLSIFLVQGVEAASTITGAVYDKQRNALTDIDVELLNDYYQSIQRTRTDGSGRYHFNGVSDGRYTIRAYAFRYDLMDQEIPLEIITQSLRGGEGTGSYQQDFYLSPKKGGLAESETGVVFAQEIPRPAKDAYEKAVKDFQAKRRDEGINALNDAIAAFPNYYLALHRMGKELSIMERYQEAVPFLLRAAEVNSKSATSLYYLGYCLHNLGKAYNKSAIVALSSAHEIAPSSVQVLYVLGKAERAEERYSDAEKHLVQAKKLSRVGIPEIHKELAQLYADNLKKYKEAADELELYLKTSKLDGEASGQTKKVIAGLRDKARTQPSGN
jgi:hypothetical protein